MPADFSPLQAQIDALVAQATKTVGTENSAKLIIQSLGTAIATAVTAALVADDAADNGSVQAAAAAIAATVQQFVDSDKELGDAIAANNPTPPPPVV